MKVTSSRLIEQKKPVLKQLLDRLLQTYSYASILMTDSKGKQYTISKQGISITENMFVELGYVVKVYDGESYGEYAFSHIDENEIDTIAEEVKNHVMPWAKKLPDDMKVKQYPEIPDEAYHFEKSTDYEVLPEELGDEEIVKRLGAVREKAMAQDEKIVEIKTACQRTSAPNSTSVSMSTAVWMVMCSDPITRTPFSGFCGPYLRRTAISPGISCSAISISLRPHSASDMSATL